MLGIPTYITGNVRTIFFKCYSDKTAENPEKTAPYMINMYSFKKKMFHVLYALQKVSLLQKFNEIPYAFFIGNRNGKRDDMFFFNEIGCEKRTLFKFRCIQRRIVFHRRFF